MVPSWRPMTVAPPPERPGRGGATAGADLIGDPSRGLHAPGARIRAMRERDRPGRGVPARVLPRFGCVQAGSWPNRPLSYLPHAAPGDPRLLGEGHDAQAALPIGAWLIDLERGHHHIMAALGQIRSPPGPGGGPFPG